MRDFSSEIFYKTARSGGKGGQNVNKVETAVEALWQVDASRFFDDEEKMLIKDKLRNRINKDGLLFVRATDTRSQLENKALALTRMRELVAQALVRPKKRRPTKPGKAAVAARLDSKKRDSLKKEMRKKDW